MSDEESISRLLAADPARGQATDLAALRRAVDERLGEGGPEHAAPTTPAPADQLAERRARRGRRMSWVAGAAASVIVGVSGYLVGAGGAGGGGDSAADGAAQDADTLVAEEAEAFSGAADDSAGGGDVAEDELQIMDEQAGSSTGAEGDRFTFTASGLSDERTTAEAFGYDATGVVTAERTQQVADALGVAGTAEQIGTAWAVTDGEGRRVAIEDDGAATFSYGDPTLFAGACADVGSDVSDPDDLGTCEVVDDPIAVVRTFLTTIGVDPGTLELVVGAAGAGEVVVEGYPAGGTAGQPVWSVVVTPAGIGSATGPLAPLVPIGSYEVVSPLEAVARLSDPRFGALMTGHAPQLVGEEEGSWAPADGGTLPWPVTTHTITSAELTLAAYPLGGGTGVLPTWRLTSDDGATWSVLAVADEFLDFAGSGD